MPISDTVRVKKAIVIESVPELKEEVQFILDVNNLAVKLAPTVSKAGKKGKLLLSPEKIKVMRKKVFEERQREKELRSVYPQLVIDVEGKRKIFVIYVLKI